MHRQTITFRLDVGKKRALDAIAASMDRDRTYVLNEAIAHYVDVRRWQLQHIEEGLRQAEQGKFASDAEVAAAFAKRRT